MRVYLASPNSQLQAHVANDMPVLLSFGIWSPWMRDYARTYSHLLIDSGAYSVHNSGIDLDIIEYRDWHQQFDGHADAIAGLDDIGGDWKKSMTNYERGGGCPTFHETDPPELLDDLVPLAACRGNWIGIGLKPPRHRKRSWLRETIERIPDDMHIHGWAMRQYSDLAGWDSMDSTNWWRDGFQIKNLLPYLTYGECLEIIVKRYQRENQQGPSDSVDNQMELSW